MYLVQQKRQLYHLIKTEVKAGKQRVKQLLMGKRCLHPLPLRQERVIPSGDIMMVPEEPVINIIMQMEAVLQIGIKTRQQQLFTQNGRQRVLV